jgi:hypothetical protein
MEKIFMVAFSGLGVGGVCEEVVFGEGCVVVGFGLMVMAEELEV